VLGTSRPGRLRPALPDGRADAGELLDGPIAARTVASGIPTMLQLALAYHSAGYKGDSTAVLAGVNAQHGLHHIEGTHRQSGFLHVFGHAEQAAAYYGYLWSQVLGDDMCTRFEVAGPLDPATGAGYRRTVLERGGTTDATLMVRDFLGRAPSSTAFLRWTGLTGLG
jgi:thimet oligopeptidase